MIRQLVESDRASLVKLLSVNAPLNLYLLGNLAMIGFDSDYCEFYGDVVGGQVCGVVNRYMTGWTVFGESRADWAALGQVVDTHPVAADRLQDNPGGIATFLPYLARYHTASLTEDTLMELPAGALRPDLLREAFVVRKATLDDLDGLITLFTDAGNMSRSVAGVELPLRDRHVWIALKDGAIVAAALTNAETEELAMIGGVYTDPAWRGNGLSQAICSGLCEELLASGRQPLLYWHDPAAGHVYTKLGFRQIGKWRSIRLAQRQDVDDLDEARRGGV